MMNAAGLLNARLELVLYTNTEISCSYVQEFVEMNEGCEVFVRDICIMHAMTEVK